MEKTLEQSVLSFPKLDSYLKENPQDKEVVLKNLQEISGEFNHSVVKAATKFLDKTFRKLYDGLYLDFPKGFDLKKESKEKHIILVPNHQSHADYIAVTYLLYNQFKTPIYIAGGINMNIFPIGTFFRKSGAFFLRRKFNDDIVYKLTFQAYVYHLIQSHKIIEFFFEGGRSRTGKLLPPRYGLFSMILEAHQLSGSKKPLCFIPVTIAHEILPEEKAHAKELEGKKKVKENSSQLVKLLTLGKRRFGSIHIHLQKGIELKKYSDLKQETQKLAFACFHSVGKGMPVTPSSLLALVMLDAPSGTLTWESIKEKSQEILEYCRHFKIPISSSLDRGDSSRSIKRALKNFINNKKVKVIEKGHIDQKFYYVDDKVRIEVLYFKNTILHHFIVPYFINAAWFKIFNGSIKTVEDLTKFLIRKRKDLRFEFYLPSVQETLDEAMKIVSFSVGEKIHSLEDAFTLSQNDLYKIATSVRAFSTGFSYIFEAYFLTASSLKYLTKSSFSYDKFLSVTKEVYQMELLHGKVVQYPESFIAPVLKNGLKFLQAKGAIEEVGKEFQIVDFEKIQQARENLIIDLQEQVSLGQKLSMVKPSL